MNRKRPKKKPVEKVEISKYDGNAVLFDVYPWLKENEKIDNVVITGPFRLANSLNKLFWPAILVANDENPEILFAERFRLSVVLGKEILVLTPAQAGAHNVRFWITLSVDYFCPYIPYLPRRVKRLAILHDVMSAEGVFGPVNRKNFFIGVSYYDALLCVSKTTEHRYRELEKMCTLPHLDLVPFQNCHHYGQNPPMTNLGDLERDPLASMSLHSIFKRKNLYRTLQVSLYLLTELTHYGNYHPEDFTEEKQRIFRDDLEFRIFRWVTNASDQEVLAGMLKSSYFICSSLDEGFSMPPMEAMICGVPYIYLSDIPVHREIYGEYNVNFFSTKMGEMDFPTHPLKVTDADREKIFDRHSFSNMVIPLLDYIKAHE